MTRKIVNLLDTQSNHSWKILKNSRIGPKTIHVKEKMNFNFFGRMISRWMLLTTIIWGPNIDAVINYYKQLI
jgi:hypothetical protein